MALAYWFEKDRENVQNGFNNGNQHVSEKI